MFKIKYKESQFSIHRKKGTLQNQKRTYPRYTGRSFLSFEKKKILHETFIGLNGKKVLQQDSARNLPQKVVKGFCTKDFVPNFYRKIIRRIHSMVQYETHPN